MSAADRLEFYLATLPKNRKRGKTASLKTAKLRHGARDPNQEYARDVEMREAVKAAEKAADDLAHREWLNSSPEQRRQLSEQRRAWEREHGSRGYFARAAAREDLRTRWAREDAERATPLAPHITRILPGDLPSDKNLNAAREAYAVEFRKLGFGARRNEFSRLKQAIGRTPDGDWSDRHD
jgi:hypothetical protein